VAVRARRRSTDQTTRSDLVNLVLRVGMEIGIVVGLAVWGYHVGGSTPTKVALAALVPLVGFGFWGAVDFHQAGRLAEALRLTQELVVSALAAAAFYASGFRGLGIALAMLSIVYHALVYASGATLLQSKAPGRTARREV
jgi:hypothetical protein